MTSFLSTSVQVKITCIFTSARDTIIHAGDYTDCTTRWDTPEFSARNRHRSSWGSSTRSHSDCKWLDNIATVAVFSDFKRSSCVQTKFKIILHMIHRWIILKKMF